MDENIKQLEIIEKYEEFVNYIYPICINIPKGGHVTLRNKMTECIFNQVELFVQAGKSNQISKLYLADAGLAMLRFYLRFLVHIITRCGNPYPFRVGEEQRNLSLC